jgi:hypothetical protein
MRPRAERLGAHHPPPLKHLNLAPARAVDEVRSKTTVVSPETDYRKGVGAVSV